MNDTAPGPILPPRPSEVLVAAALAVTEAETEAREWHLRYLRDSASSVPDADLVGEHDRLVAALHTVEVHAALIRGELSAVRDAAAARDVRRRANWEVQACTCVEDCHDCSRSGRLHVHPDDPRRPGVFGRCPVHPDREGGL